MSGVLEKGTIGTKEVIVKNISPEQFPMKYMKDIPEEKRERKVKYMHFHTEKTKIRAGIEVNKLLNRNYIFKQLDLPIPKELWKREIFYLVRKILGGEIDSKGKTKESRYKNMETGMIDYYLKKLFNTLKEEDPEIYQYWGFAQDYLNVFSKEIVEVYDKNMGPPSLLNNDTIKKISRTPFFLIICEKLSTLKAFMRELIIREYGKKYNYYGINLGKQATIPAVKLLIELSEIRNFHAFCMHDLDMSGIGIFFNMKRYFDITSIGINPEFLEYIGVNFDDLKELWEVEPKKGRTKKGEPKKTKEERIQETKDTLIKLSQDLLNKTNVSEEQHKIYSSWIDFCSEERAELDSLTAYRLEEDMYKSKARDFVNYFEKLMKDCKWNLLRVKDFKKKDYIRYIGPEGEYEIADKYETDYFDSYKTIN